MAGNLDMDTVRRTVNSLYTVFAQNGNKVNLAAPYVDGIADALKGFMKDHGEYDFVGLPHMATGRSHLVLDQPRPTLWVKDAATAAWGVQVTSSYVDTDIFPTTSNKSIRLNTEPAFREYFWGILDVGSKNNVVLLDFQQLNNNERAILTPLYQSRIGGMKVIEFDPAVVIKERGTKNINGQFETTTTSGVYTETQILPLAAEILPYEIATSQDLTPYVAEV